MAAYHALVGIVGLLAIALPPVAARENVEKPGPTDDEAVASRVLEAEVDASLIPVMDRPERDGYITVQLQQGDRLRVLVDRTPKIGWLAIAPPASAIVWIEESSLEASDRQAASLGATRAWVRRGGGVIRSGNPGAKLPGPPQGRLAGGTMVQLVDRPPLKQTSSAGVSRWLAIVPPPDLVQFIRADGVKWRGPEPGRPPIAEMRASYETTAAETGQWSADIAREIERIDSMYAVILSSQPIEHWRFENVRAGYRSLLNRAADQPGLEDALRSRLARVTRHEQAANAARTIESILAKSHRRDLEVKILKRDLAKSERARGRAFDAVGFIQPSARRVDGQKLFSLIGGEGSTIAYLDLPPGLDPEPFLAHRVGVRGQTRFNEDLGTRLITVRDLEDVEVKK